MSTLRSDLDSHVPAMVTGFLMALFVAIALLAAVSVAGIVTQCEETTKKVGPAEINEG